jgi:hypothetical protein
VTPVSTLFDTTEFGIGVATSGGLAYTASNSNSNSSSLAFAFGNPGVGISARRSRPTVSA